MRSMPDTTVNFHSSHPSAYRCRLCLATTYRALRAPQESGARLYRCTGCGVVFNDPKAWRQWPEDAEVPEPIPPAPHGLPPLLGTWGAVPGTCREHEQNPEELQRIKDAAARANKSKPKR